MNQKTEAQQKTHYRKAFNSPYLSSADVVEPVVFTVQRAALEPDKSKKTKDMLNTLYFAEREIRKGEPLKPMVLNATNSKMMKEITGSHFLEDWHGVRVQIYVKNDVRFGRDMVDGLRIMPAPQRKQLHPGTSNWTNAKEAYKRDGNLTAVLEKVDISPEHQEQLIAEVESEVS